MLARWCLRAAPSVGLLCQSCAVKDPTHNFYVKSTDHGLHVRFGDLIDCIDPFAPVVELCDTAEQVTWRVDVCPM